MATEAAKPVEREGFERFARDRGLSLSKIHNEFYDGYGSEATKRASEAWDAALERAAQVAENEPRSWDADALDPQHRIAAKIRALKGRE